MEHGLTRVSGHGQILGNTPGIVRDLFHAWTTVIPLERWGQTAASGAALFLWGYLYTIVGVFSFQNETCGVVLARDRSRWSSMYEVTACREGNRAPSPYCVRSKQAAQG